MIIRDVVRCMMTVLTAVVVLVAAIEEEGEEEGMNAATIVVVVVAAEEEGAREEGAREEVTVAGFLLFLPAQRMHRDLPYLVVVVVEVTASGLLDEGCEVVVAEVEVLTVEDDWLILQAVDAAAIGWQVHVRWWRCLEMVALSRLAIVCRLVVVGGGGVMMAQVVATHVVRVLVVDQVGFCLQLNY